MTTSEHNLLVLMDRRQKAEDRLTEAFVHLLNRLKKTDPEATRNVLSALTDEVPGLFADDMSSVRIRAQESINYPSLRPGHGHRPTPDITIRTPTALVYVEVKRESPPDPGQMLKYLWHLSRQSAVHQRYAVLLTIRMPKEDWPEHNRLLKTVRWTQIAAPLASQSNVVVDPESRVRLTDFLGFLEAMGMVLRPVSEKVIEGTQPMMHLMMLIEDAVTRTKGVAKKPAPKFLGDARWLGCDFHAQKGRTNTRQCFVGIYFGRPSEIAFEFSQVKHSQALSEWWREEGFDNSPRVGDEGWWTRPQDLSADGFFKMDLGEQQTYIEQLVESGIRVASRMRAPSRRN